MRVRVDYVWRQSLSCNRPGDKVGGWLMTNVETNAAFRDISTLETYRVQKEVLGSIILQQLLVSSFSVLSRVGGPKFVGE